jgi:hypothetical protein
MATIVTRAGKGEPLTHAEVDANFTNINADKLEASNNLSDVSSASAARTNLGLGTAATTASTDYATATQGSLADSAVQPADNISTLTNDAGYTTNVGDITGVTAGGGITGGGASGEVTISHADTSAQASLTALTGANVVSDIDLDTYGHVTALATRAMTAADIGALSTSGKAADSNLLDGIDSGSFLRSDATDTFTTLSGTTLTTTNLTIGSSARVNFGNNDSMSYSDSDGVGAFSFNADAGTANAKVNAGSFHGDGSSLTGIAAGAGGGGSDAIFWENGQNVTTNYTITNGKNAMSAGPITINSGVVVTIGAGETWTVV